MAGFSGGCLCGAIRYEVGGAPVRQVNCHCDDCRRATGSSFATNIFINTADLNITQGEPATYKHSADSGNIRVKAFCANCGSQLFGYGEARPEMRSIKVGTIDDASFVRPTTNLYVARALPFTHIDETCENFETGRG